MEAWQWFPTAPHHTVLGTLLEVKIIMHYIAKYRDEDMDP